MASFDQKDAFYSVPVVANHQKYLNFFANEYFKFTCMSYGYGSAMRISTKTTKVPFLVLRMQGHTSAVYVDGSYGSCLKNENDTIVMLQSLSFTVHPEKSILKPMQSLIYLSLS